MTRAIRDGPSEWCGGPTTAWTAAALPPVHRDPFDRVIVALALSRTLTILTSDENIGRYSGVTTEW